MCEKEKDTEKKRELDVEELEKVTGGADDSNGLPPTVPENEIDPIVINNI
ncbi:MAG: hypothetical protein IK057_02310 [Clostridia bacterium]|nr:hypothetical protein [Clostridia bacterium]